MEIKIKNNTFHLFVQKAAYWKEQHTWIISDLHIGKISHFRKEGIAVPAKGTTNNFERLDALMEVYPSATRIIFTGDLFHSDINKEWDEFCAWRHRFAPVDMDIVLGNHDKLPPSFCNDFRMTIHKEELTIGPFTFTHHPRENIKKGAYIFAGHIHPQVRITGKANQRFRFPCFYIGEQQTILPSFGYFTGGWIVEPEENEKVIAIVNNDLVKIDY